MTIREALQILKPFKACMIDQHGCPISDAAIALDVVIKELENKEWIPCSERLPGAFENPVLVSWMGIVNIGWYSCGRWETGTRLPMDGVEAWMPMPEGWKGEEND